MLTLARLSQGQLLSLTYICSYRVFNWKFFKLKIWLVYHLCQNKNGTYLPLMSWTYEHSNGLLVLRWNHLGSSIGYKNLHLTIKSQYAHVHCAMLEALTPWLAFYKFSNPNCHWLKPFYGDVYMAFWIHCHLYFP